MYFNVYSLIPRRILKKKVWILLWNNASINMFYMKKTKKNKKTRQNCGTKSCLNHKNNSKFSKNTLS